MNDPNSPMDGVWTDVGDDGSVVLPATSLVAAGLEPGGRAMVRVVNGVVELVSHMALAAELQNQIDRGLGTDASFKGPGGVDGLIVERRREFLLEEREGRAHRDAAE